MAKKFKKVYPQAQLIWFCCNLYDGQGNKLIDDTIIQSAIATHMSNIKRYAYILHDNDMHDAESIDEREARRKAIFKDQCDILCFLAGIQPDANKAYTPTADIINAANQYADIYCPPRQIGDPKEPHFHVLIELFDYRRIDEIARWFKIPVFLIEKKAPKAFKELAEYLVHHKQSQDPTRNKVAYDASLVVSNFNYSEWLPKQILVDDLRAKYHLTKDDINDILNAVSNEGKTLRWAEEQMSTPMFLRNKKLLTDARHKYIIDKAPDILGRQVFYIDNPDENAGEGKSMCTKMLAEQFAAHFYGADIEGKSVGQLRDYIYVINTKEREWQDYDYQPIVVIDDHKAIDLLQNFGGREGIKALFDPFPNKVAVKVLYGEVVPMAQFIFINGIENYTNFLNSLNGTYKAKDGTQIKSDNDVKQYSRRITGIIQVTQDTFEAMFNKGVVMGTYEYDAYVYIQKRRHSFIKIMQTFPTQEIRLIEDKLVKPIIDKAEEIKLKAESQKDKTMSDIPDDMMWVYDDDYCQLPLPDEEVVIEQVKPFNPLNYIVDPFADRAGMNKQVQSNMLPFRQL